MTYFNNITNQISLRIKAKVLTTLTKYLGSRYWLNATFRSYLVEILTSREPALKPINWLLTIAIVDVLFGVSIGYLIWA